MERLHDIHVRSCRRDDLRFVCDLSCANMKEYAERHWGIWNDELFLLDTKEENIVILEKEEKAVGFFEISPEGNLMRLRNIQVAPEYQGRGLGRYMIELALERTKNSGFKKLALRVFVDNPARGFYAHLGFYQVEEDGHTVAMEKILNDY